MANQLIQKIKRDKLIGKGGGEFPVAKKWEIVKKQKYKTKYVICNIAEGEPGSSKDEYILKHHPQEMIEGIKLALTHLSAQTAYLYIRPDYYKKYKDTLEPYLNQNFKFFLKPKSIGYLAGEEGTIINIIEGNRAEPELKPPFPTVQGLYNKPTLIHNPETFYDIYLSYHDLYQGKRFYNIEGDCKYPGVYHLPQDWNLAKILTETENFPEHKFFVQVGGRVAGQILNSSQLDKTLTGCGIISIYKYHKYDPVELIYDWIDFYFKNSCGQCTPGREGVYRLKQILEESDREEINWKLFWRLIDNLESGSFCAMGSSLARVIISLNKNLNLNLR